jgi:alkaline phosphatase D
MKIIFLLSALILLPAVSFGQYQPEEDPFRINFLGCIRQYEPAPALSSYPLLNSDISLWIGDNIYADTQTDPSIIEESYAQLARFEAFQMLKEQTHFLVTWDDHDYGDNNETRHYGLKEESKQIFREFWELQDEIPEERDGIYYSETFEVMEHHVQFIMLDVRYNLDEVDPLGKGDVLGENQWAWLEEQLQQPADLRFIASGMQILLNKENGSETWMKFPEAHTRLMETIKTSGAEGVLFLTGDQHYGEVNRMRGALDYDAIELQFASVNQIEEPENNIHRVSTVASSEHSYAYIDLFLGEYENDQRYIQFYVKDHETNQIEVSYRVNLEELYRTVQISGPERFKDSTTISFQHDYPHLNLHVSTDGNDPDMNDAIVDDELIVEKSATIKAALFDDNDNKRSQVYAYTVEKLTAIAPEEVSGMNLANGLNFIYAEGEYDLVPDFKNERIIKSGVSYAFDHERIAERDDHYAIQFSGYINIEEEGLYRFATRSDDGSKLYIGGELVVDNDGSHSAITRDGIILLKEGYHKFRMGYFEDYMGQTLQVMMAYENEDMQELPFEQLYRNTDI